MRRLLLALLFFSSAFARATDPAVPISHGEMFKFRVAWGLFHSAAEIVISARQENTHDLPQTIVTTTTSTRGVIRGFFPFDGNAECNFDTHDGRLLAAKASTSAGKKKTSAMAVFDYSASVVRYEDFLRPQRSTQLAIPPGRPLDLLTSLVQTRTWNMKPGERRPIVVMFDDEFYELVIVAQRYEKVNTPLGPVQALALAATMETSPKGMFKRGGTVRVWISRDERHLPVKFEVGLPVGTGAAYLTEYHPPVAATVADAHPSP